MTDNIEVRRLCATHRGPHAPPAEPDLAICRQCHTRLRGIHTDLPRLWDQLLDLPTTSRNGHGKAGTNSQSPVRLDVLALMDPRSQPADDLVPVAGHIWDWTRMLCDERRYTPPATISAQISLLSLNVTWWASRGDVIGDYTRDIVACYRQLIATCGEARAVIATCREPSGDTECGGPLYYRPLSSHPVACARCGDSWSQQAIDLVMQQLELRARVDT